MFYRVLYIRIIKLYVINNLKVESRINKIKMCKVFFVNGKVVKVFINLYYIVINLIYMVIFIVVS